MTNNSAFLNPQCKLMSQTCLLNISRQVTPGVVKAKTDAYEKELNDLSCS